MTNIFFAEYLSESNQIEIGDWSKYLDWTHRREAIMRPDGVVVITDEHKVWYNPDNGMFRIEEHKWYSSIEEYELVVKTSERRYQASGNRNAYHNWQNDVRILDGLSKSYKELQEIQRKNKERQEREQEFARLHGMS